MATPPDFTAGQVLTAAQMNAVGLWLISETTIGSAVSSVTVSSAFSADFENYRVLVNVEAGSTGGQSFYLTFGAAAANYYSSKFGYRWDGNLLSGQVNGGSQLDVGALSSEGGGTLSLDISDPFKTDATRVSGTNIYARSTSNYGAVLTCGGYLEDTTSYTAFTIGLNTGTITGGSILVYGYRGA